MLALRIILGIICVIAGICDVIFTAKNNKKASSVFSLIAFWPGIAFIIWSVVEIIINPSSFINWIIILIFAAVIYVLIAGSFMCDFWKAIKQVLLFLLVLALIYGFVSFCNEYVDCKPHVTISTIKILSATDGTMVNGSMSGGGFLVWHISGSVSEKPIYRYYYQLDDGGMKLGEIPANFTTIYYIEDGKAPYIEVIKTTPCNGYHPQTEDHLLHEGQIQTTYKLYVPKGSILEIFQFDGS